ncbi:MAG: hypothetical protein CO167_03050, partial [Candidatus Marinimicrobia bacterium CG_4_9_14_3_um_filter_48_9]
MNTRLQNLNATVQKESVGYGFSIQSETNLFQTGSDQPAEQLDIAGVYVQDSIVISRVNFSTQKFGIT